MVGHDPHGDIIFELVAVGFAGQFFDVANNVAEQIVVVV